MAFELSGRARNHAHDHPHLHDYAGGTASGHPHEPIDGHPQPRRRRVRGLAAIMVPFGAAASPDLTIIPVFLAAAAVGAATAVGSLIGFAAVTIATIIALTLLATAGGYQIRGRWLERWGNAVTAATLITIGTLVFTGTI